ARPRRAPAQRAGLIVAPDRAQGLQDCFWQATGTVQERARVAICWLLRSASEGAPTVYGTRWRSSICFSGASLTAKLTFWGRSPVSWATRSALSFANTTP